MSDHEMTTFNSGAKRVSQGIPRWDLLPIECLQRLAAIYEEGARVYGVGNWQKGLPYSDVYNHMMEHFTKWRQGDEKEDHLAKVAWGVFTLMWYEERVFKEDIDDMTIHIVGGLK